MYYIYTCITYNIYIYILYIHVLYIIYINKYFIYKLCNIFRFIDDLNSISDGGEFESNYSNIYPEELQLGKENTDKHKASFLDLNIKIKDGKFQFGLFDKRDSFPFSIVRMPDKSSNVPSSIVYSSIGAESLRIARASNNPESFSTAIKPLIARMSTKGYPLEK